MRKVLLLTIPIAVLAMAMIWTANGPVEEELSYRAKYGQYLYKNNGHIPRAHRPEYRDTLDWFTEQRIFPNGELSSAKYMEAVKWAEDQQAQHFARSPEAPVWTEAGPTNVQGRIIDIVVDEADPNIVYAASATGGVFKTTDLGGSWVPIFDVAGVPPVSAIAQHPTNKDILYVGTGELAGGGSYEGTGIFKTIDGGATWTNIGLPLSYRISQIVIDRNHPDTVFVGVFGGRYQSSGTAKGVYRTEDGGATWAKVLYVSTAVGCIDLTFDHNTGTVIAAMWHYFTGSGSGIWRSADWGTTWTNMSAAGTGLPSNGINAGRIGVTIDPVSGTCYALYNRSGDFYGLYKSTDLGLNWTTTNHGALSNLNASWSGGWYFGQIRVAPGRPNEVYPSGLNVWRSLDGGNSYSSTFNGIHVDQHALYILESNPDVVYAGSDGGMHISYDRGNSWSKMGEMHNTQFYAIDIDYQNPERLYGGTQDNGTNRTLTGALGDWDHIYGGDGFYVLVDYTNPDIIYAESQNGNFGKSVDGGNSFSWAMNGINGSDPFNWSTPFAMDPNDPNVLYLGSDELYQTTDGAENWVSLSGDKTGGTITTIGVSRSDPDVVYFGATDGQLHVTTDGGSTWNFISSGLPVRWITRVTVDPFDAAVAYVTQSGYRSAGELLPHIHRTTDYGQTWTDISGNLPDAPINDVIVYQFDNNRLFIGTDFGVYETTDLGGSWVPYGNGMPVVTVHDLAYHIPTGKLVAGSHGRSMWKTIIPCDDPTDSDGDGVGDLCDNCPGTYNPLQGDADFDMVGDVCDDCTDTDGDGFGNPGYANTVCGDDNCPTMYNPAQTDTDGDGLGDICDFRAITWDTIATACSRLTVGNNSNFGNGGKGHVNLDFADFGDCDGQAAVYIYDGSAVVAYNNGGNIVAANSVFGATGWNLVDDINLTEATVTTAGYDVYQTGTMVTRDGAIALEKTWWAPKQAENCEFVIQRMKVFSYDGASHTGLYLGDACDFDIPSGATNTGGYDLAEGIIYQQGTGAGCQDNTKRFGGMALIGWYSSADSCDVTKAAYGGYYNRNDIYLYPTGQFVESELYSNMAQGGFWGNGSNTDLHAAITYVGNQSIAADDTLYVYAVISTVQNGTVDSLRSNVAKARKWAKDNLMPFCGCCGKYAGDYTGNIDYDLAGNRNLSDITLLIDRVYVTKTPLLCEENGNTDGLGGINLADITRLIDHVYVTKVETEPCQ